MNERDFKDAVIVDLGADRRLLEDVDTGIPLSVFHNYYDAFRAVARDRAIAVRARGRAVIPDHVSYGFYVDDSEQSFEVVREVAHEVGKSNIPSLRALAKNLARLPDHVEPAVVMLRTSRSFPLTAAPVIRPRMFNEVTSRRVVVERSGGITTPTLRVLDLQNGKRYTLATDKETAQAAGQVLYRRADIRMRIRRLVDTLQIVDGHVLSFHPVDDRVPSLEEAQAWFALRFGGSA